MKNYSPALILLLLLTVITPQSTFAYDTAAVKYYPLAIGNSWTYHLATNPPYPDYNYMEKVTGTTSMNGHFYFIVTRYRIGYSPTNEYRRIDSLKNSIIIYNGSNGCPWLQNESTRDSIGARLYDSSRYDCNHYYRLTDTSNITLFNQTWKKKSFHWTDYFEWADTRVFAKGIGLVSYMFYPIFGYESVNLLGCVINGTLYGDTNLVGINKISSEVPSQFSLSQNYPNPFNPATSIKFSVPQKAFVTIAIYNVLGEEITKLVNEEFLPGTYETNWDAASYPSGVYYYQLTVSSEQLTKYTETKKMILIK